MVFHTLTSNLHAQKNIFALKLSSLVFHTSQQEKDKEHSDLRMYFMIIEKAIKSSAWKLRYIIHVYLPEAGPSRAPTRLRCDGHEVMDAVSQAVWRWQHSYPGYLLGLGSYYIPCSVGERDKEHFQQGLNTWGGDKCKSLKLCTTGLMGLQLRQKESHSLADLAWEHKRQKDEKL